MMKRITTLVAVALMSSVNLASAACVITVRGQAVDQADAACFPQLTDKCAHYSKFEGAMVGGSKVDVDDSKKYGLKVVNYANHKACENKPNCGPYAMELSSAAQCDGQQVTDMPGGEYRGLTAQDLRNIQNFANRTMEEAADAGKARGQKSNAKHKGKLWGND